MPQTQDITVTQAAIVEQLVANTGRHFLDSGDAYGRNWERNQGRDFLAEQPTILSVKHGYLEVTHNLFHWLDERLEYLPELDALLEQWGSAEAGEVDTYKYDYKVTVPRAEVPWLQSAQEFAGEILKGGGIYGDGDPAVINTYNGEDLLSQTIQYVLVTLDEDVDLIVTPVEAGGIDLTRADERQDDEGEVKLAEGETLVTWPADTYVLLQVHGGADVRGGYTRPYVYRDCDSDGTSILDNARAYLYCQPEEIDLTVEQPTLDGEVVYRPQHSWSTDDTCNWYANNDEGDLKEVEIVDTVEELPAIEDRVHGTAYGVKETNTLYCPVCHTGVLQASFQ